MGSLLEVLRTVPDPRGRPPRFHLSAVLTLVALALMAGRCGIAEIARFATTLKKSQRREFSLPRKAGAKAFWTVPGYSVFYQVLTRLDPTACAETLRGWLAAQAGSLPAALAITGKMIRDQVGLLTLADHEDRTLFTVAVIDQKEGTARSEHPSATQAIRDQQEANVPNRFFNGGTEPRAKASPHGGGPSRYPPEGQPPCRPD